MKDYHIASLFFAFISGMLVVNGNYFLSTIMIIVSVFCFKNLMFE